jgi:YHS domain-containing protein
MKDRRQFLISVIGLLGLTGPAFGQATKPRPEKARDPVCGIMVERDTNLAAEYKRKTYYFCSYTDRDKFRQNSQKYVHDNKSV